MTDPMTPERLAAIEAAGLALHCDACTNDGHDGCDTSDWDREAEVALDAALAVLQSVEALTLLAAEVRRLQAAVERVRELHEPATAPTSMHYYCETYDCDRAGEGELRDECQVCCEWHPCPTIAALDGDER